MGKVMSIVSRKVNRFNVESRAHRILERDKPVPAPKYESNLRDMQRALEMDPDIVEKLSTKDIELDNRLKNVYVTSKDSLIGYRTQKKSGDNTKRSLPVDRTPPEDFEYGYREPRNIRSGCCTVKQAVQFICDHQSDPAAWTPQKIAEDYKLKEKDVVNILKYFRAFQVNAASDTTSKDKLLEQLQPQSPPQNKIDSS